MGLRINTNFNAVVALANLQLANQQISLSMDRISSGLKVKRASDDPAGLVFSETLRTDIDSLKEAVNSSQLVKNLVDTADSALAQVSGLLDTIRTKALEAISDSTKVAANQVTIDEAIASIDRIAATTRFAGRSLLNGQSGYLTSAVAGAIDRISLRRVFFGQGATGRTFTATITQAASQAAFDTAVTSGARGAASSVTTVVRINGPLGTRDVTLASNASNNNFSQAVNAVRNFTGVYFSGTRLFTDDFGSAATVAISQVSGSYEGNSGNDAGRDIAGTVGGRSGVGRGLGLSFTDDTLVTDLVFSSSTPAGTNAPFSVLERFGLEFQIGGDPTPHDRLIFGIDLVTPSTLGRPSTTIAGRLVFGFLNSLRGGNASDLNTNAGNAVRITDDSKDQITSLRSFLGGISANTLDPNINFLRASILQLTDARSRIVDTDIAEETAALSRSQVIANAATVVLAQANNLGNQLVINLLGFKTS